MLDGPHGAGNRPLLGFSTAMLVSLSRLQVSQRRSIVNSHRLRRQRSSMRTTGGEMTGTWPDFRGEGVYANQLDATRLEMVAWCHGGAGVVCSRLGVRALGHRIRDEVLFDAARRVRADWPKGVVDISTVRSATALSATPRHSCSRMETSSIQPY